MKIVVEGDQEEEWTLAASHDADWQSGRLSVEVPLGKALLGHRTGDRVVVRGPKGQYRVSIVDVR